MTWASGDATTGNLNAEGILKLFLLINGAVMPTALFAVFLPYDTMTAILQWLGLGEFPEGKIVVCFTRSLSSFYAMIGILYLINARDPHVHAPILNFMACASICFGAITVIIDL